MERDREIRRDRGPAHAALRREERDDLAVVARRGRGADCTRRARGRRGGLRVPGTLDLFELVDVTDRVDELIGGERFHEEFACAGEHRPAEIVLLALDAHHDDRRFRNGVADDLGRRDPVHVRHVDVHEDHVRALFLGHVHRGLAAVGRARDFHVGLEPDQFGKVVPRVGDVVDDEDADLLSVGHALTNAPLKCRVVRESRPFGNIQASSRCNRQVSRGLSRSCTHEPSGDLQRERRERPQAERHAVRNPRLHDAAH